MYTKCGRLEYARSVFNKLPERNVVVWTAMIAGYAQHGMGQEALTLYRSMQQEVVSPNSVTYACVMQACASIGNEALDVAKQLIAEVEKQGLLEDLVIAGSIINMFAQCGMLEDARCRFDELPKKSTVAWTAMIAGYAQQGMGQEALSLHCDMNREGIATSSVTFVSVLQACASIGVGALDVGKQVHAEIEERGLQDDRILGSSLANMYVQCCNLEDARLLFDKLPERSFATWAALIAGYAQQGMGQEALSLYTRMRQEGLSPDSATYVCLLNACASVGVGALSVGKQLHLEVEEQGLGEDLILGCSLVNMYTKCGSLEEGWAIFRALPKRDVVTWTAMIAGYVHHGMVHEALSLYSCMQQEGLIPDAVTYVCLLHACAIRCAEPEPQVIPINPRGLLQFASSHSTHL